MSRAPGKYVAGAMVPAGAALDRPGVDHTDNRRNLSNFSPVICPNMTKSRIC
jgi:hypothetical protein